MPSPFLLRIGALSSLTGVNIKTLRYYDEIGVLPPQYVNPENGYRYYGHRQALLVDLLRFCTLTGIPLKEFSDFVTPDGRIRYADLLAVGKKAAEARIQEIRRTLRLLRILEADMRRWWKEKDFIQILPEKVFTEELSLERAVETIFQDVTQ